MAQVFLDDMHLTEIADTLRSATETTDPLVFPDGFNTAIETLAATASEHTHTVAQITDFPESMPASDVYTWAKAAEKPTYTASEVGAAPVTHNHTKSQITDFPTTMTPSAHNQSASTITAGTFAGQVVANSSNESYSTYLLRNTRLASSDTTPGTNGEICWTYK